MMKINRAFLSAVLTLAIVAAAFALPAYAAGGSWADNAESDSWYTSYEDAPTYEIGTAARLASFAKLVNSGVTFEGKLIKITGDIDLSAHYWVPIGTQSHPFKGTVAGSLKTVSGLTVNAANGGFAGLFGYIDGVNTSCEVSNLTVKGSISLSSASSAGGCVGAAANGAKITSVKTDVAVTVSGSGETNVGGVLGLSKGADLRYCSAEGSITVTGANTANAGGIVGKITADTEIGGDKSSQSQSRGSLNVTAGTANVGGITGFIADGAKLRNEGSGASTEYMWSLGEITVSASSAANVGGFIGNLSGSTDLDKAKFANNITVSGSGGANVGGIIGLQTGSAESTVSDSMFTTGFSVVDGNMNLVLNVEEANRAITVTSSGTVYTGGIYGQAEKLTVSKPTVGPASKDSEYEVTITSVGTAGGAGGSSKPGATVADTVTLNSLRVTGTGSGSTVGGAFGVDTAATNLTVKASALAVTADAANGTAGGAVGKLNGERRIAFSGTVAVTGTENCTGATLGGLVGGGTGKLKNTTASGTVTVEAKASAAAVGGIAGQLAGGVDTLSVSAETSVVCAGAATDVGGFIGSSAGEIKSVTAVKSPAVTVSGAVTNLGGLIGSTTAAVNGITAEQAITVDAPENVTNLGGVIGSASAEVRSVTLLDSVSVTAEKNAESIGGVIGRSASVLTVKVTVAADVTAKGTVTDLGGAVGYAGGGVESVRLVGAVAVTAEKTAGSVGGFIGSASAGVKTLTANNTVTVTAQEASSAVGGFIGSAVSASSAIDTVKADKAVSVTAVGAAGSAGGVAGSTASKITGVTVSSTLTVAANAAVDNLGGIAGSAADIEEVAVSGALSVTSAADTAASVGGIAGRLAGTLDSCTLSSSVDVTTGKAASVGGAVGTVQNTGRIGSSESKKLTFKGAVTVAASGDADNIGGAVGFAGGSVKFVVAENAITVTAEKTAASVGGVVGSGTEVSDITVGSGVTVTAKGAVNGLGGIVGSGNTVGSITVNGGVTVSAENTSEAVGGTVGKVSGSASNVTVNGSITVTAEKTVNELGGVIGLADTASGKLEELTANGSVTVTAKEDAGCVGGVIGKSGKNAGSVSVTGAVKVNCSAGFVNAGGAVGSINGNLTGVTLEKTVEVTCGGDGENVGGAAGCAFGNVSGVTVNGKINVSVSGAVIAAGGAAGSVTGSLGTVDTKAIEVACAKTVTHAGGIAGFVGTGASNVSVTGTTSVTAEDDVESAGGAFGRIDSVGITALSFDGSVTVKCGKTSVNAAGAAGSVTGNISGVTVDGTIRVTATGNAKNAAGIAALVAGDSDTVAVNGNIIVKCESIADKVGGVFGAVTGSIGSPAAAGFTVKGDVTVSLTGGTRPESETADVDLGGFIGCMTGNAYNLTVEGNTTVTARDHAPCANVGGVAANMEGSVGNLVLTGNINVTMYAAVGNAGGIAGKLNGNITSAAVNGNTTVAARSEIIDLGGNTGAHTGDLSEFRYTGDITARAYTDAAFVGGISGVYNGTMSAVHTSGLISVRCAGEDTVAGGIAASFDGSANGLKDGSSDFTILGELTMTLSGEGSNYTTGVFAGSYTAGAFAGVNNGTLENISLGDKVSITLNSRNATVGGFAGVNTGTVRYAFTTADIAMNVSTNGTLGGLVGDNSGVIERSFRDIEVALTVSGDGVMPSFAGGLVGTNSGTVEKSYTDCDVVMTGSQITGGGLIGAMTDGIVSNSYSGDRTVAGGSVTGGLIGSFSGGRTEYCYSAMKVDGSGFCGGIFGEYLPETVDGHVLLCRFLSDGINYNMLPAGKGGEGILDGDIKYIRALSGAQLQDGRAESGYFNYMDFDAGKVVSWDFENVWQFVITTGAKYIYPSLILDANTVTLNYDIRWFTENREALTFTLATEEDLAGFAMILNGRFEEYKGVDFAGKTVEVVRNINIQRSNWEPVENFKGTFDGGGCLINGLHVSGTADTGLFGTVLAEVTIRNLTIETDSVSGLATAGAAAGINNGTIENAVVIVKNSITAPKAGGIAGVNNGRIAASDISVIGSVSASLSAGGAAGENAGEIDSAAVELPGSVSSAVTAGAVAGVSAGSVTDSSAVITGSVSGKKNAGGLAGVSSGSAVRPAVTAEAGGVITSETLAGGIAANNTGAVTEPVLVLNGTVTAPKAGGVAGESTVDLASCRVTGSGTVTGTVLAGGIVSHIDGISVTDSAVSGITVSGNGLIGGVAGEVRTWAINAVAIDGVTFSSGSSEAVLGGIAGRTTADTSAIAFTGSVNAVFENAADAQGGIIGTTAGDITSLTADAAVTAKLNGGADNAGGLIGFAAKKLAGVNAGLTVTIEAAAGTANLGGVAGKVSGDVDNFRLDCNIAVLNGAGAEYVGGIAGELEGKLSAVHCSGNIGVQSAGEAKGVGGIVGRFTGSVNGLAGAGNDFNILGSITVGVTGSRNAVGAFVGVNDGTVKNLSLGDNVSVTADAAEVTLGGFAGINNGTLDFVYATSAIDCSASGSAVLGGITGVNTGVLKRSVRDIPVSFRLPDGSGSAAGSIAGKNSGTVTLCYADGTGIGPLVGNNDGGTASDCETEAENTHPAIVLATDDGSVSLNYDLRWYTADPDSAAFTLEDEEDLAGFAMIVNGRFEEFTGIDFAGKTVAVTAPMELLWGNWEPVEGFKGAFDGAEKLIWGLRVSSFADAGLFGTLPEGASAAKVWLDAAEIEGTANAGAVAAVNNGTVSGAKITVLGSVTAPKAGGIAGANGGAIADSAVTVEGTVSATLLAGGAAGENSGTVSSCTVSAAGSVVSADTAGGAAAANGGTVENCAVTVTGTVSGKKISGGMAGNNTGFVLKPAVTVSQEGSITSAVLAGGIAGANSGAVTEPAVVLEGIITAPAAGGVAGESTADLSLAAVSGAGTVRGSQYAGGIVSRVGGIGVYDCAVSGITVTGDSMIGGAAGELTGGIIENALIESVKLTAGDSTISAGGVAGRIAVSSGADSLWNGRNGVYQGVYRSKVTGLEASFTGAAQVGTNRACVGGIAGEINVGTVYDSEAEGTITATGYLEVALGGAAGRAESAYVAGSSASVGIKANYARIYDLGGFIGRLLNSTVRFNRVETDKTVEIAYEDASAPVQGMYAGGFAGRIDTAEGWTVSENTSDESVRAVSLFTQSGNVCVGGFAGQIGGTEAKTKVSRCYALGDAYADGKAYSYAGGFVGEFFKGSIDTSYASGNRVTALSPTGAYAGGFAGRLMSTDTQITDCYAVDGTIYSSAEGANAYSSAFYGNNSGSVASSYASAGSVIQVPMGSVNVMDNEFILPAQNNALGEGLALDGFSFSDLTWLYVAGVNDSRPVLGVFAMDGFMPELNSFREMDLGSVKVADADGLAAAAYYLNDRTIARLVTDGRTMVAKTDVELTGDVDLTGVVYRPIGEIGAGETLNGAGHTVSGLHFSSPMAVDYALVRRNSGTVKNLTVANTSVSAGENASAAVAVNDGTIENVKAADTVSVTGSGTAGAIAAVSSGTITGAESAAEVAGMTAGGIVGFNGGTVSGSASDAKVRAARIAEGQNSGGVAGVNDGVITGAATSAEVSGYYAGGIAGTNGSLRAAVIKSAQTSATVNGDFAAGGAVGYNFKGTVGDEDFGNVTSTANVNTVVGYAGGIVGINSSSGTVTYCDTVPGTAVTGAYTHGIAGSGGFNRETCRYEKCAVPDVDTDKRTFSGSIDIKLICDSEDANIYYTLDGTEPTAESALFDPDIPIHLTETTTIRAFATRGNMFYGDSAEFVFTEVPKIPTWPVIPAPSPVAGLYDRDSSVSVEYGVEAGTAILGRLTANDVAGLAGDNGLVLDLTVIKEGFNDVEFPKALIESILSTGTDKLTVKLPDATVTLDGSILKTLSAGDTATLSVLTGNRAETRMSGAQNAAVGKLETAAKVSAYLYSGTTTVTDFGDGAMTVSLPLGLKNGQDPAAVRAYSVAENGSTAVVDHKISGADAVFTLKHPGVIAATWCPMRLYTDLSETAWYHEGVHNALVNGIMQGDGAGLFMPDSNTNRAMIAQILYNLEGRPDCDYEIDYADVAKTAWYYNAIRWATAEGIIQGYGDGYYGPDDDLNREQLVTVMYRYAKLKGYGFKGLWAFRLDFGDAAEVSPWASEAMHWMVMNGVINGIDGDLVPQGSANRAMIATVVMRLEAILK